jgi:membrane protein DedA with SNARE-associated domain
VDSEVGYIIRNRNAWISDAFPRLGLRRWEHGRVIEYNLDKETIVVMPASIEQASSGIAILVIVFFAQALKEMGIPSLGLTHSLLLYAGYQFSSGSLYFGMAIILFTFLGSLSGACLIFYLTRSRYKKILATLLHYSLIKSEAMARARSILIKSSFVTISIGRSIPGLMLPTSILAGTLDFSISSFLTSVVVTLSLWVVVIVTIGTTSTYITPQINISPDRLILFLAPFIILGLLSGAVYMWKKNSRFQSGKNDA